MQNTHQAKENLRKSLCLVLVLTLTIGVMRVSSAFAEVDEPVLEEITETEADEALVTESSAAEGTVSDFESAAEVESETGISEKPKEFYEVGTAFTSTQVAEESTPVHTNSISGMLWIDMYEDTGNAIYGGDGVRQTDEEPLAGYTVNLYKADDTSSPVQTTTTDAGGIYEFCNLEPGNYIVGVASTTISGIEYLLPFAGTSGDNRFTMASDYVNAYSDTIQVAADTVASNIDAGMRTPPTPQTMASATVSYYGRLVDKNNTPICNAPVFLAVLYTAGAFGPYAASTQTTYTDNNGNFSYSAIVPASTAASWDDAINLVIGFPSPFIYPMSAVSASNTSYSTTGWGSITPYTGTLSAFSSSHPNYLGRSQYRLASYDLRAIDTSFSITIGGASMRQTITVNSTVDYTVTESFYGLDTGNNNLRTQKISSFGSFYAENKFTGYAPATISYSSRSYKYLGYRLNATSGLITAAAAPSYNPVGATVAVNYYYAPPNYPPAAYAPTYASGLATSVTVTGQYDLNGGTSPTAWLERSKTSATTDFENVGGLSDNISAVVLSDSGLIPNTRYWYRTCISTDSGNSISAASEFITPPRVDTAAASVTGTSAADIFGTIAIGGESINDVIITCAEDIGFTQNAVILYLSSGDVTLSSDAYSAYLTGLTSGQTYYVRVVAIGPGGLSEAVEISFKVIPTVTIEYVNMNGTVLNTSTQEIALGGPFTHTPSTTNYRAEYYTQSTDGHAAQTPITSANPTISFTVSQSVMIRIYFVSTLIDITAPAGVEFYALSITNGVVTPDNSNGKDTATITNNSDMPVKVSLREMTVNSGTSSELTFLSDVTTSTVNRRIHLNLLSTGEAGNGFTNNVNNIVPNSTYASPAVLGTLDGTIYTATGGTGTGVGGSGTFEVGGKYVGDYPINPAKYIIDVSFNFYLEIVD